MSIDDIDWGDHLSFPSEEQIKGSLECKFNSHTYQLMEAAELINAGKTGLAWGILYEMLPKTAEQKAEKHYLLSNIYIMQDKWKLAEEEAKNAMHLMPSAYQPFHDKVSYEYKRQGRAMRIAKYIMWGILITAAGLVCYMTSQPKRQSVYSSTSSR